MNHLTTDELDAGLDRLHASPQDHGVVEMIVCRPDLGARRELERGELVVGAGLVGDNYVGRGSKETDDGLAHPAAQLNLMNSRSIDIIAGGDRDRWALAGDQFFVDLDLSAANITPGTRLSIGTAVIEVSAKPHNGCAKFRDRFGIDAARWVNADRCDRRRGINATVVEPGVVSRGDVIRLLD